MKPYINILIVNWYSSNNLEFLLLSLANSSDKHFRVIIVDNSESIVEFSKVIDIAEQYEKLFSIKILKNINNGYAGGNNKAYKYLEKNSFSGDILILNPDVRLSYKSIETLRAVLCQGIAVGGVMCRTVNSKNEILYDKIILNGLIQKYQIIDSNEQSTDYLAGSCMLLSRSALAKVGLFDEEFFMYWEEVDLSLRMRAEGLNLLTTRDTFIIRGDNPQFLKDRSYYYYVKNAFRMKKKKYCDNFNFFKFLLLVKIILIKEFLISRNFSPFIFAAKGLIAGLKI